MRIFRCHQVQAWAWGPHSLGQNKPLRVLKCNPRFITLSSRRLSLPEKCVKLATGHFWNDGTKLGDAFSTAVKHLHCLCLDNQPSAVSSTWAERSVWRSCERRWGKDACTLIAQKYFSLVLTELERKYVHFLCYCRIFLCLTLHWSLVS